MRRKGAQILISQNMEDYTSPNTRWWGLNKWVFLLAFPQQEWQRPINRRFEIYHPGKPITFGWYNISNRLRSQKMWVFSFFFFFLKIIEPFRFWTFKIRQHVLNQGRSRGGFSYSYNVIYYSFFTQCHHISPLLFSFLLTQQNERHIHFERRNGGNSEEDRAHS